MKQVLINLLSNAIKYSRPDGLVSVICEDVADGRVRVSVRDTGVGLSADQLAQLFQAFNRLGQEGGAEEGTGIGLVVAKRLVELMGGAIGAESTVGVGSVFWFELVAAEEPGLPAADVPETPLVLTASAGTHAHTLLYVEDNPANLKLVQQIVARRPNIGLLSAVDGLSGVEAARVSHPDMILMDIDLPDISGFEALRLLRADPATAGIPAIALSANAMPRDIRKGLKAGFLRYMTKPIRVDEFMAAIDAVLEPAADAPDAHDRLAPLA